MTNTVDKHGTASMMPDATRQVHADSEEAAPNSGMGWPNASFKCRSHFIAVFSASPCHLELTTSFRLSLVFHRGSPFPGHCSHYWPARPALAGLSPHSRGSNK
jgi:hypothetical protein